MEAGGRMLDRDGGRQGSPGSPAELVMGLQLLRASAVTSTRLQLALARRDRRQILATLDGLTDLDDEIEEFMAKLPSSDAPSAELAAITRWIAEQKAAIASDKFSLVCGIAGSGLVSSPEQLSTPVEPDPEPSRTATETAADAEPASEQEAPVRRRWPFIVLAVVVAVLAAAAALYVFVPGVDLGSEIVRLLP